MYNNLKKKQYFKIQMKNGVNLGIKNYQKIQSKFFRKLIICLII